MKKNPVGKPKLKAESTVAPPIAETADTALKQEPVYTTPSISDDLLKKLFYGSLVVMLLIVWFSGFNVGYHQDEMDMNNYGHANLAYYTSGGKDTSFRWSTVKYHEVDSMLKYYGSAFEHIAVGAIKLTGTKGGVHEFNVRHFVNQIFAIVALLFTGLFARKLIGWRAALIAIWLAFLSPSFSGHFLFNTKDIPFCAGYMATLYYILHFLEELPAPSWKTALKLMVAYAFTTDIRIGGVIVLFYFFVFTAVYVLTQKGMLQSVISKAGDILTKYITVILGGYILVVLSWPYLLQNPIKNTMTALGIVKKFPLKININYDGIPINSLTVPGDYIPRYMSMTTPVFILIFIFAGLAAYFIKYKKYNTRGGGLLLLAVLFPPLYAIQSHASLYSGWRHFLFIYPGLCIFASAGISEVLDYLKKPAFQMAFGALALAAMFNPIRWSIKNHPYEYTYFNEVAGGFRNAYYNYDNDYWEITALKAVDWLMNNEPIRNTKDTVLLSTNLSRFVEGYLDRNYHGSKIKVTATGCTARNSVMWTYAVFNTLFIKPDYLENYFPPAQTIHSEDIDGLPVTVIVKDTERLDYKAFDALKLAKHAYADSLYDTYIKRTKDNNPALFSYMSVAKSSLSKNDEAIALANKCLQYHFSTVLDYNAYCGLGIAYGNKGDFKQSISNLQAAQKLMPKETYANDILKQVYSVIAQQKAAGILK
jgi:tetratricopeptide (TPR) repeat protein